MNEHIRELSSAVADEVSRFVKDYQESAKFKFGGGVGEQAVPFNAEGIFLGAIAGLGTMGALAVCAAVVAAGSNLGGYLLVGSIVSSLSAMGDQRWRNLRRSLAPCRLLAGRSPS